jgi:hypothetical protein
VNRPEKAPEPSDDHKRAVSDAVRSLPRDDDLSSVLEWPAGLFPAALGSGPRQPTGSGQPERARKFFQGANPDRRRMSLAFNKANPLDTALAETLQKHFKSLGAELNFVTDPKSVRDAYNRRNGVAADLTLMRIDAADLSPRGHAEVMGRRSGSKSADLLQSYLQGGLRSSGRSEIEGSLLELNDYIPVGDRVVTWATRRRVDLDLHIDGQLGNLGRLRYRDS